MKRFINYFLFIIISQKTLAQVDSSTKKFSVTPLPIIVSDPFIGFGYGVLANANFMLGDKKTTRFSNAQLYLIKTTHGQFAIQGNHTLFTNNEDWMIQGKLQYLDWPENTFALGARSSRENDIEKISYKALEFEERIMKRIGKKNFIGLQYRLYNCWNLASDKPDSTSFFAQHAIGTQQFTSSSIGLHFINDSRDNVQNAFKGNYAEIALNPNFKELGSTQTWTNLRVDLRTYFLLNNNEKNSKVLALRTLYEQAFGNVPYMIMPMFGRYFTTRGYVQGRYRGKTFMSVEAEYRAHIWKAIGCVVFAGVQTVSEPDGSFQYINPSTGLGARIMLNKSQRTNLRIDYAKGLNGEGGLYLQVTEAF